MPGTVHLLVGAAIATLVPNVPVMVVLAFFSHYILDLIPHLDPDTFADDQHPYTWWQKATLTVDVILVFSLLLALFWLRQEPFQYLLGAVVGLMPDILTPLESYPAFTPLKKAHELLHWNKRRARWWSWYVPALLLPVVISTGALLIIWGELNT
ncbi:MAG: hypothetical protein HYR90_04565 [Candidatus Andersenbacteria bacterium]|nr:hypothetical protein [Candidatus Andersenbacteria bacterium]MBI3250455.1 hypothetical protein [Candidatus Andersenbacteria bacterium]